MKALAEYVVQGWKNAAKAAFILGLLPFCGWIGAAVVALINLRKGFNEGLPVMLWAGLPSLMAWVYFGDIFSAPLLISAIVGSLVWRRTVSMFAAILSVVAVSMLVQWLVLFWSPAGLDNLRAIMEQLLEQSAAMTEVSKGVDSERFIDEMLNTSYGFSIASSALVSLFFARGWQAQLYNPGGFQEEFHNLQIPSYWCVGLMVCAAIAMQSGGLGVGVALLCAVPMLIAGIALVHSLVKRLNAPKGVLFGFYGLAFILGPSLLVPLMFMVVLDSFIDIRGRLSKS
ncbi:MAG: hypothetical protein COB04_10830 [Gammaproteobacteria bacterium]|nr:MAG: hypothetical protein COB04_10830 [Gammaproteobacteria bacterium]